MAITQTVTTIANAEALVVSTQPAELDVRLLEKQYTIHCRQIHFLRYLGIKAHRNGI